MIRRLWCHAFAAAVGFGLGWLVADAYVRGRFENDAGGAPWEFPPH